jgi:hypothetical protein
LRKLWIVTKLVDVVAVKPLGGHRLSLEFADGVAGEVAFDGREWRRVFEPLRDPEYFDHVVVDPEIGMIAWPNGVDMAPEPLYEVCAAQSAAA